MSIGVKRGRDEGLRRLSIGKFERPSVEDLASGS